MAVNYELAAQDLVNKKPRLVVAGNWRGWLIAGVVLLSISSWAQGKATPFMRGNGGPQAALSQKLVAANSGDMDAQLQVGKLYFQGKAGREQRPEAVRWLRAASDQGSVEASAWLGACYLLGRGVGKDEAKAQNLLEIAAGKGDPTGLRFLGLLYERRQDYTRAAGFYAQAIEQGDNNAVIRMARLYAHGQGMSKDKRKADGLLTQAATKGGEWAQLRLGRMYEVGNRKAGIAKDPALAMKLYSQAASQGNRIAAYRLGQNYSAGTGKIVAKDPKKALEYYKQSALRGYAPAQYELARMREQGQGVELSLVAAYYWYSMAQRRNHELASERLLDLRTRMDAGQIRKAEELLQQHDAGRANKPKP